MKRKILIILFTFASIVGVFIACQDDLLPPEKEEWGVTHWLNGNNQEEIVAAQKWYAEHKNEVTMATRSLGEHPLFKAMEPHWQECFTRQGKKEKTVEIALMTLKRKRFVMPECQQKYEETKNLQYLQSMTRLVIKTDLRTGEKCGFFMTIMPSVKYLELKKFKPFYNTYVKRDRQFDGYIVYHELNGQLANGWKYSDGIITHRVSESVPQAPRTRSGGYNNCTRYCQPIYLETCTEYHTLTEWSDNIDEIKCSVTYLGDYCWQDCVYIPDPDPEIGGGGGGGYEPEIVIKRCPVCQLIQQDCVCAKKENCNEDALQNAMTAGNVLQDFKALRLDELFIAPYQGSSVEYGCLLNLDPETNALVLTAPHTNNIANNVSLNYQYGPDETLASIHNHPGSTPPSLSDVTTLAKVNHKSGGKFTTSFILAKDGSLYALQVQDQALASQFFKNRGENNDSIKAIEKKQGESFVRMLTDCPFGIGELDEIEFKDYALAYVLNKFNTGIVLLWCCGTKTEDLNKKMPSITPLLMCLERLKL